MERKKRWTDREIRVAYFVADRRGFRDRTWLRSTQPEHKLASPARRRPSPILSKSSRPATDPTTDTRTTRQFSSSLFPSPLLSRLLSLCPPLCRSRQTSRRTEQSARAPLPPTSPLPPRAHPINTRSPVVPPIPPDVRPATPHPLPPSLFPRVVFFYLLSRKKTWKFETSFEFACRYFRTRVVWFLSDLRMTSFESFEFLREADFFSSFVFFLSFVIFLK